MKPEPQHIRRRPPEKVMTLGRLGSLHQSRLSFMRVLMRRMASEKWSFSRPVFCIDGDGVGHAVYTAKTPLRAYSLVAFAHDLPDEKRSDRVIAEAWDATFALFDGVPDDSDIARLARNVPFQEAGRVSEKELTLSRANRSVRLWTHVVDALAAGRQPDATVVDSVGYLMRTTAVYGSGKFGAADREAIAERPEMTGPFQAEMLTVYLIRTFVRDLVQHMARIKGGSRSTTLTSDVAMRLGIGNSTGLGMAPFLINHPILFNNWIMAREEAIARVRSIESASPSEIGIFLDRLARSERLVADWNSEHPAQVAKLVALQTDLATLRAVLDLGITGSRPWNRLFCWAERALSEEGQELLGSLILEPYPDLVDGLACCMSDSLTSSFRIDGSMPVGQVRALLLESFGWAQETDWTDSSNCARVWYVSQEKLEPRLGERFDEPVAEYEQPLAPARDACAAIDALGDWPDQTRVAEFLLRFPQHRAAIRRAQMFGTAPYGEIRGNTIGSELMPIDMLRAKLSFFGATHFDPRSDRWVRICMYSGAPYPEDLSVENADDWVYPRINT